MVIAGKYEFLMLPSWLFYAFIWKSVLKNYTANKSFDAVPNRMFLEKIRLNWFQLKSH